MSTMASAEAQFSVIQTFKTGPAGHPQAGLVADAAGRLYGTATFGSGSDDATIPTTEPYGAVFRLSPPRRAGGKWTKETIYAFPGGEDGANPASTLVIFEDGDEITLYGTTTYGGLDMGGCLSGCGTVFSLRKPAASTSWIKRTLYRFQGGVDGARPTKELTFDGLDRIYGTTSIGGMVTSGGSSEGNGTVFRLDRPPSGSAWIKTAVHSFFGAPGPATPYAGVTLGTDGRLYGTTNYGGTTLPGAMFGVGTVYQITFPRKPENPAKLQVLYRFEGGTEPRYSEATVYRTSAGTLFTTSVQGGLAACTEGCGTVFRLQPPATEGGNWTKTVLHRFDGNFGYPRSGLAPSGTTLYGTTERQVYSIAPSGGVFNFTSIYDLTKLKEGNLILSPVLLRTGSLYGTAFYGGACEESEGCGTAFQIVP